jgi:hypothetical protein
VNPTRTATCACGVNVGTAKYVLRQHHGPFWQVLIPWKYATDVVVPYNTDGKFRAGAVQLLREVSEEEMLQIAQNEDLKEKSEHEG